MKGLQICHTYLIMLGFHNSCQKLMHSIASVLFMPRPYSSKEEPLSSDASMHPHHIGIRHIWYKMYWHSLVLVSYSQGKPNGEAFIQMQAAEKAFMTAGKCHMKYMGNRFIEVFQCSAEEMSFMLTGGAGVRPKPASTPPGTLGQDSSTQSDRMTNL